MALTIDKEHTALLAMDFENDIVHEDGAFKEFGFAAMVKQNDVLAKSARLLDAAPRSKNLESTRIRLRRGRAGPYP